MSQQYAKSMRASGKVLDVRQVLACLIESGSYHNVIVDQRRPIYDILKRYLKVDNLYYYLLSVRSNNDSGSIISNSVS